MCIFCIFFVVRTKVDKFFKKEYCSVEQYWPNKSRSARCDGDGDATLKLTRRWSWRDVEVDVTLKLTWRWCWRDVTVTFWQFDGDAVKSLRVLYINWWLLKYLPQSTRLYHLFFLSSNLIVAKETLSTS